MLLIAFGIPLLAILLIPVNPKLPKGTVQRMRCRLEISDIAAGLKKYKTVYQVYPSGNKSSVWKQLAGDNPQKIIFTEIRADTINTNGEFLDPWETPYGINFLSTNSFVISSAGPNKKFGNADDIVFNSASNDFVKP